MSKITNARKEVMEKSDWFAIVTEGPDGPVGARAYELSGMTTT